MLPQMPLNVRLKIPFVLSQHVAFGVEAELYCSNINSSENLLLAKPNPGLYPF
jgi:hypothetical protein